VNSRQTATKMKLQRKHSKWKPRF